ncbi:MAG: hypothetical protein WCB92_33575, partial [Mycobacterium sp.]
MRAKLGLSASVGTAALTSLLEELLRLMQDNRVDYTSFFRNLASGELGGFGDWVSRWRALAPDPELMDRTNPIYIPRNHLVEEALSAATAGDLAPVQQLLDAVTAPFDRRPDLERYASSAPDDFGAYRTFCGT